MTPRDLSKFMSLILRHKPQQFGVVLDAEGFTPMDELLVALRSEHPEITKDDIVHVAEKVEPEKKRFTITEGEIRANYGHSIDGKIKHEEGMPPSTLYHGTHEDALPFISSSGLKPMGRQYVHLTTDYDLATRVGSRRGKPVVLRIKAYRAYEGGVKFYKANEMFWLVDSMPADYIRLSHEDTTT